MRAWAPNWDLETIPAKIFNKERMRRNQGYLPGLDLGTIPEREFNAEMGRRNNAKRKVKSGGVIWSEHVPEYSRCRCAECNLSRTARKSLPQPPKRPVGRPPRDQSATSGVSA